MNFYYFDPLIFLTLTFLLLCMIGLSWFAGSDAPYVTTSMKHILKVLKLSGLKKDKNFYELGSGDGRVVFKSATIFKAKSYGIEQSWIRVWFSRLKARQLKINNAFFFHGDIFQRQYFTADVIYIYLLQKAVDRLEDKLQKELKKGAVVITQTYHFKNWQPFKKYQNFYLYKKI